jgi:hypothetical protein
MVDGARGGDHEVLRAVVGPVVLPHGVPLHRLDRLGAASDGTAQWMPAEHGLEEALARDIRRVVVGHREFLEDDAALVLELDRVDQARHEHVGKHVDRHREVLVAHLRVVAGVLLRGERIVLTADRIERHRDVERGTRGRALEQQVLEEVRRAERAGPLVTRADGHPVPDRGTASAGHVLGQDPHAARQHAAPNERIPGCGERQFGQVQREGDSTVHHPESLPVEAVGAAVAGGEHPPIGASTKKCGQTDWSVCPHVLSSSSGTRSPSHHANPMARCTHIRLTPDEPVPARSAL